MADDVRLGGMLGKYSVIRLKGEKPDVVFFGGMDAAAGPMLRQMKQLGIEAKVMGGDGTCMGKLLKLAVGAMVG